MAKAQWPSSAGVEIVGRLPCGLDQLVDLIRRLNETWESGNKYPTYGMVMVCLVHIVSVGLSRHEHGSLDVGFAIWMRPGDWICEDLAHELGGFTQPGEITPDPRSNTISSTEPDPGNACFDISLWIST